MSRLEDKIYYYAKITVEAETPLVLASGKSGNIFDMELVRDANGLPAIPGTTITGILRHQIMKKDTKLADKLFGSITEKIDKNVSSFECSWGYIHDSKNHYEKGNLSKESIENDPLLKEFYKKNNPSFHRDHTKLNDKGTVDKTGKFDRSFVPAGTRFTFSIGMWTSTECQEWNEILEIIHSPVFRIGGAGHAGYGKLKIIDVKIPEKGFYDLSNTEDLMIFKDELKLISKPKDVHKCDLISTEITLNFPMGFRIGGGKTQFLKTARDVDMKPYSEKIIEWNGDNGKFSDLPKITIPGSSVKGALRHRAAFHLARLSGNWFDENLSKDDELSALFGDAETENKNSAGKKVSVGRAGKIWFTDLHMENVKTYVQSRTSIDRFTGGTRKSALFQEENALTKNIFKMNIYYDSTLDKKSKEVMAFLWALEDLKQGRLAIGGGSGHGLGFNQVEGE